MSETGILHYFEKKFKEPDECDAKRREKTSTHTLSIFEVAAMFVVLAVGVGTSTLVLTIEILLTRFKQAMWKVYRNFFSEKTPRL